MVGRQHRPEAGQRRKAKRSCAGGTGGAVGAGGSSCEAVLGEQSRDGFRRGGGLHPAHPPAAALTVLEVSQRQAAVLGEALAEGRPVLDVPAAASPLDPSLIPMPMAGYVDTAAALRGRYLSNEVGVCLECHTRHVMGDPNVLDYSAIFAGGERFEVGLPAVPVSSNLTSDPETGLGNWTVDDIVRVLEEGADTDSEGICPPMPVGPMGAYAGLTDADARDIAHYIKSLPPVVNAIDDVCTFPPM
jgi:hypothetical protein